MTTFWGVCGSCSHDWDTNASATGHGLEGLPVRGCVGENVGAGWVNLSAAHVGGGERVAGGFAFGFHSIKIAGVRFALDRVENANIARDYHQRRRSCGAEIVQDSAGS